MVGRLQPRAELLRDARTALAHALTADHRLRTEIAEHEGEAERWRRREALAQQRGEMDLALLTQPRVAEHDRLAAARRREHAELLTTIAGLRERVRRAEQGLPMPVGVAPTSAPVGTAVRSPIHLGEHDRSGHASPAGSPSSQMPGSADRQGKGS